MKWNPVRTYGQSKSMVKELPAVPDLPGDCKTAARLCGKILDAARGAGMRGQLAALIESLLSRMGSDSAEGLSRWIGRFMAAGPGAGTPGRYSLLHAVLLWARAEMDSRGAARYLHEGLYVLPASGAAEGREEEAAAHLVSLLPGSDSRGYPGADLISPLNDLVILPPDGGPADGPRAAARAALTMSLYLLRERKEPGVLTGRVEKACEWGAGPGHDRAGIAEKTLILLEHEILRRHDPYDLMIKVMGLLRPWESKARFQGADLGAVLDLCVRVISVKGESGTFTRILDMLLKGTDTPFGLAAAVEAVNFVRACLAAGAERSDFVEPLMERALTDRTLRSLRDPRALEGIVSMLALFRERTAMHAGSRARELFMDLVANTEKGRRGEKFIALVSAAAASWLEKGRDPGPMLAVMKAVGADPRTAAKAPRWIAMLEGPGGLRGEEAAEGTRADESPCVFSCLAALVESFTSAGMALSVENGARFRAIAALALEEASCGVIPPGDGDMYGRVTAAIVAARPHFRDPGQGDGLRAYLVPAFRAIGLAEEYDRNGTCVGAFERLVANRAFIAGSDATAYDGLCRVAGAAMASADYRLGLERLHGALTELIPSNLALVEEGNWRALAAMVMMALSNPTGRGNDRMARFASINRYLRERTQSIPAVAKEFAGLLEGKDAVFDEAMDWCGRALRENMDVAVVLEDFCEAARSIAAGRTEVTAELSRLSGFCVDRGREPGRYYRLAEELAGGAPGAGVPSLELCRKAAEKDLGTESIARVLGEDAGDGPAGADLVERLTALVDSDMEPLGRGMLGLDPVKLRRRTREVLHGDAPDSSSEIDRWALYSIVRTACDDVSAGEFDRAWKRFAVETVPPMPSFLGPVALSPGRRTGGDAEAGAITGPPSEQERLVEEIAGDARSAVAMAEKTRQIGAREKKAISSQYDGSPGTAAALAKRLAARQVKNYQPAVAGIIDALLVRCVLAREPALAAAVLSGDSRAKREAVEDIFMDRLPETRDEVLGDVYREGIAVLAREALGVELPEGFRRLDLNSVRRLVTREITLYSGLAALLKAAAPGGHVRGEGESGNTAVTVIRVKASKGRPLAFFQGLFEGDASRYLVREYRHDVGEWRFLVKEGGSFTRWMPIDAEGRRRLLGENIGDIEELLDIAPEAAARYRGTAAFLQKRVLPLLDAERKLRGSGECPAGDGAAPRTRGDETLLFMPARDAAMCFKGNAGEDCTRGFNTQVFHPRAYFYRIIHDDRWVGYLTLLDVMNESGERALVVDVINARRGVSVRWAEVFRAFVVRLAGMVTDRGYRYILLPDSEHCVSNYDYIRKDIFAGCRSLPRVPHGEFWLESVDAGFHSTKCEFLVLWENRVQWGEGM